MAAFKIVAGEPPRGRVEWIGLLSLLGFVAALQISIAAANIMLGLLLATWLISLAQTRRRPEAPPLFLPLVAFAGMTLVSAAFSLDPVASLVDCKQLVLFLIVPAVYHFARGARATTVVNVIISVAAVSAGIGIVQFGLLHYDTLSLRPRGSLGHYMTYSGLLMLVTCAAAARLMFGRRDRIWPALVMPALLVALAITLSRNAWVGTAVAALLLVLLHDTRPASLLRVTGVLAAAVAAFILLAPSGVVADRLFSVFSLKDPSNRDRVSMAQAGFQIVRDHPLTGVGPNMVERVYPEYRRPDAVQPNPPHLHNVVVQIAAERGLPALALWGWFVVLTLVRLWRLFHVDAHRVLPAAGLAAMVAMLTAGMFEHNFGDSEFLMLLLVLVTLPFASARRPDRSAGPAPSTPSA